MLELNCVLVQNSFSSDIWRLAGAIMWVFLNYSLLDNDLKVIVWLSQTNIVTYRPILCARMNPASVARFTQSMLFQTNKNQNTYHLTSDSQLFLEVFNVQHRARTGSRNFSAILNVVETCQCIIEVLLGIQVINATPQNARRILPWYKRRTAMKCGLNELEIFTIPNSNECKL